jgi:hypothetical protein
VYPGAHRPGTVSQLASKSAPELCFTPTYASWANPIEAYFGPLRQFTIANSHHSDILVAQRRERARIRSEKGIRWGGRPILESVA